MPNQTDLPPLPAWGDRAYRAYENLKGYFPAFAITVLVLNHENRSDTAIGIAAAAYVVGRVLHFAMYTAGLVTGRAIGWILALVANVYLLARCF